jgi:short-subunit dehydrogenase
MVDLPPPRPCQSCAFAPKITAEAGASILNILSVLSETSFPGVVAYFAGKSDRWSLTNSELTHPLG